MHIKLVLSGLEQEMCPIMINNFYYDNNLNLHFYQNFVKIGIQLSGLKILIEHNINRLKFRYYKQSYQICAELDTSDVDLYEILSIASLLNFKVLIVNFLNLKVNIRYVNLIFSLIVRWKHSTNFASIQAISSDVNQVFTQAKNWP